MGNACSTLVGGRDDELDDLQRAALAEVEGGVSDGAVQRFTDWAVESAKEGATSAAVVAVAAVITATSNGLLHDLAVLKQMTGL